MKNNTKKISIVVPVYNELKNIEKLIIAVSDTLSELSVQFEIIFVDDHSTDGTYEYLQRYKKSKHIIVLQKKDKRGKAFSLQEGFAAATGDIFAMIDADLQYPALSLAGMIKELEKADVIVANRKKYNDAKIRKILSKTFRFGFGKLLFGLDYDIQSGLKVFKKEVYDTVVFEPRSGWTFDLEFLYRAKESGFVIHGFDITFSPRSNGRSNVSFLKTTLEIGFNAFYVKTKKINPLTISPTDKNSMIGAGIGYKRKKYITHTTLSSTETALHTLMPHQKVFYFLILASILSGLFFFPLGTVQLLIAVLSTVYFIDVLFNLILVLKSLYKPQELSFSDEELADLEFTKLPLYTILCPLYREAHVIPHFLESIDKLSWPKEKLDVILLLEEDDTQSIDAVAKMHLPLYVRVTIVPHSMPKTKPKACNYGLAIAKGEYLVIYDAEDSPEPMQLKKAYLGFQTVPSNIACLQAKLNYYNPHQNLLTRFFTAEYSLWFDVSLTGLQAMNTAIPLGGTSNHFRTKDLRKLQGWDPFNVTEDADLGMRLFRAGSKTAIIDSITLEEANSNVMNWVRQRSRWIKGYMQTYLVHNRNQFTFYKDQGIHGLFFQLTIGGKIAFILINPFLWLATIAYFTLYAYVGPAIETLYPTYVFYMAVTSLVFGNFLFLYYYMIGCMQRKQYTVIKYVYLVPFYWLLISWAGFIAFYQLLFKPHYWEKTIHGLHLNKKQKEVIAEIVIETEEAQSQSFYPKSTKQRLVLWVQSGRHLLAGSMLVIASVVANFLNFAFNAYLGNKISLTDFGDISLVGSFLYITSIPFGALVAAVNYRSGVLNAKYGNESVVTFWTNTRKKVFAVSIGITLLWLFLTPVLMRFFNTTNMLPFVLFAPIWFIGFLLSVDKGILFGKLLFGSLAIITLVEPVGKFISAVVFVEAGQDQFAYMAIPLSIVITFAACWLLGSLTQRGIKKSKDLQETASFPKKFFAASFLTGLSALTFLSLDIVLAKHFLSPEEAGKYALISLVGKMVYFIGGLSHQFILPLVSQQEGKNKNTRKTFYVILFSSYILSFLAYVAFGLLSQITIPVLFGQKAVEILPYLPYAAFAMLCFTVSRVFVTYYMAKKVYSFPIFSFGLSILQIILITFRHESIVAVVSAMVITGGLNLIFMIFLHLLVDYVKIVESNIADFFNIFAFEKEEKLSEQPRILIFNWRDTRHTWAGGAEVYIHEIARRFVKQKNAVTIFCGNDGHNPRNQVIDNISIIRRGGSYTVYFWAICYYLFRFRGKYDVIIDCENGIPFFTPLFVRKPIILLIHHIHQEVFREHLRFPLSVFARFLEAKLMPYLYKDRTIITVSESSKKEILRLIPNRNNNIHIVHPGINQESYERGKKSTFPLFTYLGRLKAYKNIDIAIKAYADIEKKYKNAKLFIVGEGEYDKKLYKLAEKMQLKGKVIFMGKVSEKTKAKVLSQSWAVLQPSMMEGWGITVIEANACGTPVIASNVSGLKDSIVDGLTGILVKVRDQEDMAQAMEEIILAPKYRALLAKEAYTWSEKFSWDKSTQQFYDVLTMLLTKKYKFTLVPGIIFSKK